MNPITWIHITGGLIALLAGTVSIAVQKGGRVHTATGTGFCVAMLVLGVTAAMLAPLKTPAESPLGGIMVCYFVATAWMAARRRNGTAGGFERIACASILVLATAIIARGLQLALAATAPTAPPGPTVLFVVGGLCLLAGLLDLRFILRGNLNAKQRIARHLWRMCSAFFLATGSFFLGQQDVLPMALRGSPILLVLAFAPLALMLFWLLHLRYRKPIPRRNGGGHPVTTPDPRNEVLQCQPPTSPIR